MADGSGFEVLGELGRGAMGVVYRARERSTGREVALKVALERLDAGRTERFQREGQVTASLDHPGIVRVHSAGILDGRPYLAYELVQGCRTLGEAMRAMSRPERLRLVRDAALAIGHAHARGVIHRDVKADNLLLETAGDGPPRMRVADFGLARFVAPDSERLTRTGALVGTPTHMAPEQVNGEVAPLGPATDVWALGVVLYELLTDELPFQAEQLPTLCARILEAAPAPARSLDPTISIGLEAIVDKSLRHDPTERYPDATAFAADLTRALEGRPVEALRAAWHGAGRRRLLLGLIVVALFVGAVMAGVTLVGPGGGPALESPPPAAAPKTARVVLRSLRDGAEVGGDELLVEGTVEGDAPWFDVVAGLVGAGAERRRGEADRAQRVTRGRPFALKLPLEAGPQELAVTARASTGLTAQAVVRLTVLAAPTWFAAAPASARPALPLAAGLRFGPRPGEYVNVKDGSVLVWVPPATFRMGSDRPGEGPPHEVTITRGFYIGKYEVTWRQNDACRRDHGLEPRRRAPGTLDEHPVTNIDWSDSADYCRWAGLRLPTEAEWELAARGTDGRLFPWGNDPPGTTQANVLGDDPFPEAAPVGSFPAGASPCGALDMAGNVFEWTTDRHTDYPATRQVDPMFLREGDDVVVVRGGSWNHPGDLARSTGRGPGFASNTQGFRVAR